MPPAFRRPCAAVLLSSAVLACAAGCPKPPAAKSEPPPAPVTVATASVKTVPVQVRAIGAVRVISTVSIRPRVGGELTEVHFKEGDDVVEGQKLFVIDPRPYDTAVKQAEANVAKDRAVLTGAEVDLKRLTKLESGVSAAEMDTARTAVASAQAALAADEAALRSARLQLGFTTITAPIAGRTGALLVTRGNLVNANDPNPLVVINQVSPIDVAFALPEQQLPAVTDALARRPLTVEAELRDGRPPARGVLSFIDNAVDPTTGTVGLKAEFENKQRRLWPGQFVDVVLAIADRPDSVTVPLAAVQSGQQGQYVYVVTPQKTAEMRPVTVVFEVGGEAVLSSGLKGGESVVTEGQLRLSPGAKVEVKNAPAKPAGDRKAAPAGGAG